MQYNIEFDLHAHENNQESQTILQYNLPHFKGQCVTVFNALMRGEVLTTAIALNKYAIGDLRARIRDIKNTVLKTEQGEEKFYIHELTKSDRYKCWWFDSNDQLLNKILLNKFNQIINS